MHFCTKFIWTQLLKIKVGIAGETEAIANYLPYIQSQEAFEIIGSFDSSKALNFESFYGLSPFTDFIDRADAIVFCGSQHHNLFDLLSECIKGSKHILFEKFPDLNFTELSLLHKYQSEADTQFYISNIHGLGCTYTTARQLVSKPSFVQYLIQIPYNTPFNDGSNTTLLNESIDMVLRCVNSPVSKVKIDQQYIFNQSPDEVKLNITFDNKANAEIIMNHVSLASIQTLTLYQKGKIIKAHINQVQVEETKLDIHMSHQLPFDDPNASQTAVAQNMNTTEKKIMYFDVIQKDLMNFVDCINNRVSPLVSLEEAMSVFNVMQHLTYNQHESLV